MRFSAKAAGLMSAVGIFTLALVGCSSAPVDSHGAEGALDVKPALAQSDCRIPAALLTSYDDAGVAHTSFTHEPKDSGVREFAEGTVGLDTEGHIVSYTVAAGDVVAVIAERLCLGAVLASMNHVRTIQPGQVLWLNPDPEIALFPYFGPTDAPAGFIDSPYQQLMEEMGRAVDAGDIDAARSIWTDRLESMFFNKVEIAQATQALDDADFNALRQMFS